MTDTGSYPTGGGGAYPTGGAYRSGPTPRGNRHRRASKLLPPSVAVQQDVTCNSEELRAIMTENMSNDTTKSKRKIKEIAEAKLNAKFNVICAVGDLSYFAYAEMFCQTMIEDMACYAFKAA